METIITKQEGKHIEAKEVGEIYDKIINNWYDVLDMIYSLQLILSLKEEIPKLDVLFFMKATLYSSIKQHSLQDQIEFMYALDKLNLLIYFLPKY